MRLGKPTRLEREMHRRIIQEQAQKWMAERGYMPGCGKCGSADAQFCADKACPLAVGQQR